MELYRHAGRMKMKQNRAGEVEYLTFPLLEQTGIVRHLFTTRLGGVSQGVCSSMNLSYARGDERRRPWTRISGGSRGCWAAVRRISSAPTRRIP